MSDTYTPDEAELARWFRLPPENAVRQRDGEYRARKRNDGGNNVSK